MRTRGNSRASSSIVSIITNAIYRENQYHLAFKLRQRIFLISARSPARARTQQVSKRVKLVLTFRTYIRESLDLTTTAAMRMLQFHEWLDVPPIEVVYT
jgi:hypothetical protein